MTIEQLKAEIVAEFIGPFKTDENGEFDDQATAAALIEKIDALIVARIGEAIARYAYTSPPSYSRY